jgi:hypothetical protein
MKLKHSSARHEEQSSTFWRNIMSASAKKPARKSAKPAVTSAKPGTTERVRPKAADAMANRGRLTFGEAYVRDVIAGVQRDFGKQLAHAVAIGLDTRAALKKLEGPVLREKLGAALKKLPKTKQVWSATPEGEVIAMMV